MNRFVWAALTSLRPGAATPPQRRAAPRPTRARCALIVSSLFIRQEKKDGKREIDLARPIIIVRCARVSLSSGPHSLAPGLSNCFRLTSIVSSAGAASLAPGLTVCFYIYSRLMKPLCDGLYAAVCLLLCSRLSF